ncbi:MAG: hypothetical protein IPO98_13350 [Saprospiraceae bacterium]|nr:hypothetical protein [Saprospiraceae bacterium]
MKLYKAGVRHFKGLGNCLVYHFGSKSTTRIKEQRAQYLSHEMGNDSQLFSKVSSNRRAVVTTQILHQN